MKLKENLEQILCPICKSSKNKIELNNGQFQYLKCMNCNLIYRKNYFSRQEKEELYVNAKDFEGYLKNIDKFISPFNRILNLITKFKNKGKLLDIGCNLGLFLSLANKRGFETYGVELSKAAVIYARKQFKLNVLNKTLKEAKFKDKYFDIVVINHVIEHVEDPISEILEIRRILKDDGILILGTPNYNSIFSKILRERWPSIQPKYHLFLFSPQTINLLFKRTGFKLVYLSTENREFNTKNILIKSAYNFMSEIISKLGYGEAMLITASKSDIL